MYSFVTLVFFFFLWKKGWSVFEYAIRSKLPCLTRYCYYYYLSLDINSRRITRSQDYFNRSASTVD